MKIAPPFLLLGTLLLLLSGCSKPAPARQPDSPTPAPTPAPASAPPALPPPPAGLSTRSTAAAPAPARVASAADGLREARAVLSVLHNLRSRCDNAAWVLWHSNDYEKWRRRQTSMLSMNYSYSVFDRPPPAPAAMPAALRERFDQLVPRAAETLNRAGDDFRDLATYVNARDYQDDGFKKGDALNARLLELGQTSHGLTKDIERLYADYADTLLQAAAANPKTGSLAGQLRGDLQAMQALALEMSKGKEAQRAVIEAAVADISERVEARKAALAEAPPEARGALERFYRDRMEERVAVPMRKLLRETRDQPKAWTERLGDRPRSATMQLRDWTLVQMPGDAVSLTSDGQ